MIFNGLFTKDKRLPAIAVRNQDLELSANYLVNNEQKITDYHANRHFFVPRGDPIRNLLGRSMSPLSYSIERAVDLAYVKTRDYVQTKQYYSQEGIGKSSVSQYFPGAVEMISVKWSTEYPQTLISNWEQLQPVKVLYHSGTNIRYCVPVISTYDNLKGPVVIQIDIVELVVQFTGFYKANRQLSGVEVYKTFFNRHILPALINGYNRIAVANIFFATLDATLTGTAATVVTDRDTHPLSFKNPTPALYSGMSAVSLSLYERNMAYQQLLASVRLGDMSMFDILYLDNYYSNSYNDPVIYESRLRYLVTLLKLRKTMNGDTLMALRTEFRRFYSTQIPSNLTATLVAFRTIFENETKGN